MFERFTERARQVVVLAQEEARTLKHNYIGTAGSLGEALGPEASSTSRRYLSASRGSTGWSEPKVPERQRRVAGRERPEKGAQAGKLTHGRNSNPASLIRTGFPAEYRIRGRGIFVSRPERPTDHGLPHDRALGQHLAGRNHPLPCPEDL